jgi:hypothetical protein
MARVIARSLRRQAQHITLRAVIVCGCALALILAGML